MPYRRLQLSLIFTLLAVLGAVVFTINNHNNAQTGQGKTQPDLSHFPLIDYDAVLANDPNKDTRRQEKSKKYNSKHAPQITESTDQIFHIVDWDPRLPALPVARSAAIVNGEVVDGRAYLAEDKTDIYSEFSVRVDEILKNDIRTPLKIGDSIIAEREGGRIRFPSGKIVVATVNHQDMPRIGRKYIFFLTHSFPRGGELDGFYLLTAYELRTDLVFPLDKVSDRHAMAAYKGTLANSFLSDLHNAIATTTK